MFICIWCEDLDRGIAKQNAIPWVNKIDLKLFKTLTLNHDVVMGKNTYLSLSKPLVHRNNIVFSSTLTKDLSYSEFHFRNDLNNFINQHKNSKEVIYVIGGKTIYDAFIKYSKILVVSKLVDKYDCDLFMDNSFNDFKLFHFTSFDDFSNWIYVNKKVSL